MKCLLKIIGLMVFVAAIAAGVAYYMTNYYTKRHTIEANCFDNEEIF